MARTYTISTKELGTGSSPDQWTTFRDVESKQQLFAALLQLFDNRTDEPSVQIVRNT